MSAKHPAAPKKKKQSQQSKILQWIDNPSKAGVLKLPKSAFFGYILQHAPKLMLVKFGAPWCGPCEIMKPNLEKLAEHGAHVLDVNLDKALKLGVRYDVGAVPTVIIFEKGEEKSRAVGYKTFGQLQKMLEKAATVAQES